MDERTQGALLLAVGGVALRLGLTDAALAYVKAGLQPLLVATGVVLVVLGAAAVLRAFRQGDDAAEVEDLHGCTDDDGHGHGAHGPRVAWMLTLPLLAVLLVAPPPLGAFAAGRASDAPLTTTQTHYPPLPEPVEGAVELTLSEFIFRALYDEDRSLEGQRVRLTGFVTAADAKDDASYRLTRFVLNCCAADGRPIHVAVLGDDVPRVDDTWLAIEGVWEARPGVDPGDPTMLPPLLRADEVTPIPQPENPYEY